MKYTMTLINHYETKQDAVEHFNDFKEAQERFDSLEYDYETMYVKDNTTNEMLLSCSN